MSTNELENTFVFIILGDEANKVVENSTILPTSKSTKCRKFVNYCLYSNSIVISRLAALRGIPENNIFVFCYGDSSGYDMTQIPTNKVFFQLTIDEIYVQTHEYSSATQFRYFRTMDQLYLSISAILSSNEHPNFLVFMEDHGLYEKSRYLDFYELYRVFLRFTPKTLNIFADCCHSGYFLYVCQIFNNLHSYFNSTPNRLHPKDFLSLLSKLLQIFSSLSKVLVNNHHSFESIFQSIITFFAKQKSLPIHQQRILMAEFMNLHCSIKTLFEDQLNNGKFSFFRKHVSTLNLSVLSQDNRNIVEQCFTTIGDLYDVCTFISKADLYQLDFETIFNKFNSPISFLIQTQKQLKLDSKYLCTVLSRLLESDIFDTSDFRLQIPSNLFVCTTSHPETSVPTFGTRRITDEDKIVMGSPGMSAFIYEALLFPHHDGICLNRLKKLAQGTGTQIMQYAVSSAPRQKQWLSLDFRSYGVCRSLPFSNIPDDKCVSLSAKEILNMIGFNLLIKFEDDHETPQDENFPVEPEENEEESKKDSYLNILKNYCSTNYYFQISPKRKRRIRLEIFQNFPAESDSDRDEFYQIKMTEIDEYYSDDDSPTQDNQPQFHKKKENENRTADNQALSNLSWSLEIPQKIFDSFQISFKWLYDYFSAPHEKKEIPNRKTLLKFNWNQEIPQKILDPFQISLKHYNMYVFALRDTFFTVFQRIKSDDYIIDLRDFKVTNGVFEIDIQNWINYFIPETILLPHLLDFLRPMASYIVHTRGEVTMEIQEWFFISFNIADQIITPKFYDRKTFIKNRLKNRFHLPQITSPPKIRWGRDDL